MAADGLSGLVFDVRGWAAPAGWLDFGFARTAWRLATRSAVELDGAWLCGVIGCNNQQQLVIDGARFLRAAYP